MSESNKLDQDRSKQDEHEPGTSCQNMHENVEVWEDICVCEPEPRWQALGEEMERQEQESKPPQD